MSPTPFDHARNPGLGHDRIPKERYTSADFARREWDGMWTKVWLLAGRESDLAAPGDYCTFEIGPESILVVRQADGTLAARYNVCMHRGNRLCEPGRGHAPRKFTCRFHGWQYGLDGALLRVTDPQCFPQGLPSETLSLRPVRCDTWGGFVWISLNPEAEPLRHYLGVIPDHLAPYHFDEWAIANDVTLEVACNWKTSVDAFNEAYHIMATHAWTLEFTDDVNTVYECYERHSRMIFPEAQPSPRHPGRGTITPFLRDYFLVPRGIDPTTVKSVAEARTAIAAAIRQQGPALGCDFSELSESQLNDDFHYTIFPNVTLNIHAQFTWVFTHRPHPDDPQRMYFDFVNLVRMPAHDVPRPQKETYRVADGASLAHIPGGNVLDEDMYNLPRIQAGMRSAAFTGLHLSTQEIRIRHFHHTLMQYLQTPSECLANG
jgi:phenylpropionate dioxygenase-like ring-hydroxylating dioxygenase large terminal subunit